VPSTPAQSYFLNIYLYINLPSMPGSSKWSHSFTIPHTNLQQNYILITYIFIYMQTQKFKLEEAGFTLFKINRLVFFAYSPVQKTAVNC
jgi:hypothetical protein